MSSKRFFPTGSCFTGMYLQRLECMHGIGTYVFPNGSEYRGYFVDGKFHGHGRWKINNFLIVGDFKEGRLVKIWEIIFADGLRFKGDIVGNALDATSWSYLTARDRRYSTEHIMGLQPVGPTSHAPPRSTPEGSDDAEEDNSENAFNVDSSDTIKPSRHVVCKSDGGMLRDYRQGVPLDLDQRPNAAEPNEAISNMIIDMNLSAADELGGTQASCDCNALPERKRCMDYLGQRLLQPPQADTPLATITPSSSNATCLSAPVTLLENVEEKFHLAALLLTKPERFLDLARFENIMHGNTLSSISLHHLG